MHCNAETIPKEERKYEITRNEEMQAAKAVLAQMGCRHVSMRHAEVRHGSGTARGWLDITVTVSHALACTCTTYHTCDVCRRVQYDQSDSVENAVAVATGRNGLRDDRIAVHVRLA